MTPARQGSLFDAKPRPSPAIAAPSSNGTTSKAAARALSPGKAASDRERIYDTIRELGPLTDEEISMITTIDGNTVRPRRVSLVESGRVRDSGRTKLTLSGRKAIAWEAVK